MKKFEVLKSNMRPRRSVLYMPGENERALKKGRELKADVLIMDLEDGVAPHSKQPARLRVIDHIKEGGYGTREICVRINGEGTEWYEDDISAVAKSSADAVVLPKVNDQDSVLRAVELMEKAKCRPELNIWCMIETARGVLNADSIAASHSRVSVLILGGADLTKDLKARHLPDRTPLLTSIQVCVLAARAHGLGVLDSPFFDLSDDEGFLNSCCQGRDFGFDGKTLLHPKTLEVANRIFSPSKEELEWAFRIKEAHEKALSEGKGVTLVDGQLVESLHVAEAQRLVEFSEVINTRDKA